MALTGLQIQKLLPKTNCKECGSNTCLAFAMKLAAKQPIFRNAPMPSAEAKRILGAASELPVMASPGPAGQPEAGRETVLYRHEKRSSTDGLAVNVSDADDADAVDRTLAQVRDYAGTRRRETAGGMVGVTGVIRPDAFAALARRPGR